MAAKMIQVRHVPQKVHATLKARAAKAGTSLSEYLVGELERIARMPTPDELAERIRQRAGGRGLLACGDHSRVSGSRVIVVDASCLVEWLLGRPKGAAIGRRLFHSDVDPCACLD